MSNIETLFVMRNGIETLINKSDLRESDKTDKPEEKPAKKAAKKKVKNNG